MFRPQRIRWLSGRNASCAALAGGPIIVAVQIAGYEPIFENVNVLQYKTDVRAKL